MKEQSEPTFSIPVVWEVRGMYNVRAKNIKHALSKVIRHPKLPEQQRVDMDKFQIVVPEISEVNQIITDEQLQKITEEIKECGGWEEFAEEHMD